MSTSQQASLAEIVKELETTVVNHLKASAPLLPEYVKNIIPELLLIPVTTVPSLIFNMKGLETVVKRLQANKDFYQFLLVVGDQWNIRIGYMTDDNRSLARLLSTRLTYSKNKNLNLMNDVNVESFVEESGIFDTLTNNPWLVTYIMLSLCSYDTFLNSLKK